MHWMEGAVEGDEALHGILSRTVPNFEPGHL